LGCLDDRKISTLQENILLIINLLVIMTNFDINLQNKKLLVIVIVIIMNKKL